MPEAEPLSPRKTAVVLLIVGGCFAVLWPRILQPALLGRGGHDPLAPNSADRAQGCCDVIFETDVNAIKIMIELCSNILERKSGPLDPRTAAAFASGKLPPDIITACRLEVNATCGVDISTFLQQNIRLGKTYKQILEDVRSYNSSACLRMHYGVPTWALGTGHSVAKTWSAADLDNVKQERPPRMRGPAPHPAMLERGRAIPAAGEPRTPPPRAAPDVVRKVEGRVRSPLSVYYVETEPPPIPGMRPPLGGAGGTLPPPKSSMGFVMPMYTIGIVVFFVYTLCKILFKRTDTTAGGNYESVAPDPLFRRRVFEDRRSSRASPESKLVVSAISGLVAEVQQQMEASYAQSHKANGAQVTHSDNNALYTNGTLLSTRDISSPVSIIVKEYKEVTPEPALEKSSTETKSFLSKEITNEYNQKDQNINVYCPKVEGTHKVEDKLLSEFREITPTSEDKESCTKDETAQLEEPFQFEDKTELLNEITSELENKSPELEDKIELLNERIQKEPEFDKIISTTEIENKEAVIINTQELDSDEMDEEKQSTPEMLAEAIIESELQNKENGDLANGKIDHREGREDDLHEPFSEEEIEYELEEDEEESPLVRQLRASVEKDKATVKVLGMETTAHCEGGGVWRERPLSASPLPPASPPARPHEAAEVSSIYLEGDIPQQSRLLVADSETLADRETPGGKDSPVVLSGKMTLSLINDDSGNSPDRDLEPATQDDDDFTTASAYTQPKLDQQETELSEEEIEEEIEEIEEEVEVEEIEVESDENEMVASGDDE